MVVHKTMIHPLARQKGLTERGNTYVLSQDAPNRIHLTLQNGNYVMNVTLENLKSEEEMIERRNKLEDELIDWMNPNTETHDETTQPLLQSTGSDTTSGAGLDTTNPESL
jgi:hypothetical protein